MCNAHFCRNSYQYMSWTRHEWVTLSLSFAHLKQNDCVCLHSYIKSSVSVFSVCVLVKRLCSEAPTAANQGQADWRPWSAANHEPILPGHCLALLFPGNTGAPQGACLCVCLRTEKRTVWRKTSVQRTSESLNSSEFTSALSGAHVYFDFNPSTALFTL